MMMVDGWASYGNPQRHQSCEEINDVRVNDKKTKKLFLRVVVAGPEIQHMKVGVGHRLDVASSGVLSMVI